MPIACAHRHKLSFSRSESAKVHKDYLFGEKGEHPLTGECHDFCDLGPPFYAETLLPEGAPPEYFDPELLWSTVDRIEKRKDLQVATVTEVALPSDDEVTDWDRLALARKYVEADVADGVAVQIVIHAPTAQALAEQARGGKKANWHLHVMTTTRRIGAKVKPEDRGPEGFHKHKARDRDPVVRRIGGRGIVTEADHLGEAWRAMQNDYFREQGYRIRVDLNGLAPENHVGPTRTWPAKPGQIKLLEERRAANRAATYDVDAVLEALTQYGATFTGDELDRFLTKQLGKEALEEIAEVRALVLGEGVPSPDLRVLDDPDTPSGRYSTWTVYNEEQAILAAASALTASAGGAVPLPLAEEARRQKALNADQDRAFDYATAAGHLKLIAGRAGTGKSYTLTAVRKAHEAAGKRVIGLAPTNMVAQDMKADGFAEAYTVHMALTLLKNGKLPWGPDTVVIVDEAAMIATPILKELMKAASPEEAPDRSGKLILVGDDRQLPSIERGGMFAALLEQYKADPDPRRRPVELSEVVRQEEAWQRQAARDLADYDFDEAVAAFEREKAIGWTDTAEEAQDALVAAWARDRAAWKRDHPGEPDESRFVFAYTNADVNRLNAKLRKAYGDALTGPDVLFDMSYQAPAPGEPEILHEIAFAQGDRIQFTKTERKLISNEQGVPEPVYNGDAGEITAIDAVTGKITATIDRPGGQKLIVSWLADMAGGAQSGGTFNGLRHAYAGTIHKGQGRTLERTYLYHSPHWTAAPSYVALTRQRKSAAIFAARETAATPKQLARQMARQENRSASISWATQDGEGAGSLPLDHAAQVKSEPIVKQEEGAFAGKAIGDHQPGPDAAAPRASFFERRKAQIAAQREQQRASVERIQARGIVRDWSQRIDAFRAALPTMAQTPADYAQTRDRLLDLARPLAQQPGLAAAIRQAAVDAGPAGSAESDTLMRLLDHPDPAQAIADIIAQAERQQQERDRTPPTTPQPPPTRPRDQGRGR